MADEYSFLDINEDNDPNQEPSKPSKEDILKVKSTLKTMSFKASKEHEAEDEEYSAAPECNICYMEFNNGDKVVEMTCKHILHEACVDIWF